MSALDLHLYSDAFKHDGDSGDLYSNHLTSRNQGPDFRRPRERDNSSDHNVSQFEVNFYYYGLRDRNGGPKLIYRRSKNPTLSGPIHRLRIMKLLTVHNHAKLSQNNLWDTIRDETADILDHHVKFTSIDLVRFGWHDPDDDTVSVSPVTIWIGVRPRCMNGNVAFSVTEDISRVLERHGINDIDIAFRESENRPLSFPGPVLYAPVRDIHPLNSVVDWVSTSVSSPIAGLTTPHIQGTLGFYFKDGEDLYGVTARHVLFPVKEGNYAYKYNPSIPGKEHRKKGVVLMGTQAFKDLLATVEKHIEDLTFSAHIFEREINKDMAVTREENQQQLDVKLAEIAEVRRFLETLQNDWSDIKNRIIGHVVWSPPLSGLDGSNLPLGYMRDVCVIKLDKTKFLPNLTRNEFNLGKEFNPAKFVEALHPRFKTPPGFRYPLHSLYRLKSILPAAHIKEANVQDKEGDLTRIVSKHGPATGTTIGRLNGFLSRTRYYSRLGSSLEIFDSINVAVFPPPDRKSSPSFSGAGDSGAAIVGSNHEIIAQINAGTGSTSFCDITYGTPMEWLWKNVIKPEFPDAILFFDPSSKR